MGEYMGSEELGAHSEGQAGQPRPEPAL